MTTDVTPRTGTRCMSRIDVDVSPERLRRLTKDDLQSMSRQERRAFLSALNKEATKRRKKKTVSK